MTKIFLLILFVICSTSLFSQKQKADSLMLIYKKEKIDTNKVILLWQMSNATNLYNPDTSLLLAQQALHLAEKIRYDEGQSRSLGSLAAAFTKIGNYPKALEFYLQKLKIDESSNSHRNLASTYISTGVLYVYLEQYYDALAYYKKADSVIRVFNVSEMEYYSNNNLGDVYERLNMNDSAFLFFSKALAIATKINDPDFKGASMVGLGHIYLKQGEPELALPFYLEAITLLESSNDDDLVCEATLGLAKLYDRKGIEDSTENYALRSFSLATKDGFQSRQLDAAVFLAEHYKKTGDIKNAFAYIETVQALKDSISSNEKIRASQIISSNEQLRQIEISENKRKADEERHKQLQILLIGIFIPGLFLITLLLNRVKTHHRVIRFLAILSLLMFFEYLLLLLHPRVAELTHHNPIYEILIFVAVASILAPTHHRFEHWFMQRLARNSTHSPHNITVTKTKKKHIKKHPIKK